MFRQPQTMGTDNRTGAENDIRLKLDKKERLEALRSINSWLNTFEVSWEFFDQTERDAISDCIQELEQRC